jgi:transcriptional regulator with PAS, ATPase and Fis domain
LDPQAGRALLNYEWPGNVRELFNLLERLLSTLEGDTIRPCDLPFYFYQQKRGYEALGKAPLKTIHASTEREAIRYVLKQTGYNKSQAAKRLGIHRTLLYKKMKKYHIPIHDESSPPQL